MKKIALFLLLISALSALKIDDLTALKKDEMRADFKLIKKLTGFERNLVSFGEFELKNDELFYIVKSPINSVMKVNKDGVFYEENGEFKKSEGNYDKGLFLALIKLDFKELEKNFSINLSGNKQKWQIILKPSNVWLKKIFTHIIIQGGANIDKIELFEINKDKSTYEISPKGTA